MTFHLLELQRKKKKKKKPSNMIARYHALTEVSPVGIFGQMKQVTLLMLIQDGAKYQAFHFKMPSVMLVKCGTSDDRNILFEDWNVAASNEEISVSEYRFLKPDGQVVWVMG
jgi:hypothetical protein